jgi:metal-responsive CopG/Arc/MetJ family transcriptional regulator
MGNKRMTVSFSENAYEALEKIQNMTGKSKAEILRTALTLLYYAEQKKQENNSGLAIIKDGEVKQEIVIP